MQKVYQNLVEYIIEKFDGVILEDNQWTVDGSKGNRYIVEWDPYQRKYSCNCLGYTYRRRCKHITQISDSFKKRIGVLK